MKLSRFVWTFAICTWIWTAFLIFTFGSSDKILFKKIFLIIFFPLTLYIGVALEKYQKKRHDDIMKHL
jgi:uncharacterized membrane protein